MTCALWQRVKEASSACLAVARKRQKMVELNASANRGAPCIAARPTREAAAARRIGRHSPQASASSEIMRMALNCFIEALRPSELVR